MSFKIEPGFSGFLRPLRAQEREHLRERIQHEGCAPGAIVVGVIGGERILVDGHSTVAVCQELGKPLCQEREIEFKDFEQAWMWMESKQRGRRNLTDGELAAVRDQRIGRVAKARDEGQSIREIARNEGVSETQVRRDVQDKETVLPSKNVSAPGGRTDPQKHEGNSKKSPEKRKPRVSKKGGSNAAGKHAGQSQREKAAARISRQGAAGPVPGRVKCPTCKGAGDISEKQAEALSRKFTPPTVEEVAAYCKERKNDIDAEAFVAFYTANGWVQGQKGGKPVKDWKGCVITWEKMAKERGRNGKPTLEDELAGAARRFVDRGKR